MSEPLAADSPIDLCPGYRFQWEPAQNAHVLLYPEGMIKLSETAGFILEHCNGSKTGSQIIATLQEKFPGADLADDVNEFLSVAAKNGWIRTPG